MDDLISRQAAIDALKAMAVPRYKDLACEDMWERDRTIDRSIDVMRGLPSAQPEIIRCRDCAKREYCRTSTVWAVAPKDDWYCADAERKEA